MHYQPRPGKDDNIKFLFDKVLSQTDNVFKLLIDGVSDHAIFLLDAHGVVATWNSGGQNITGYKDSEIVGSPISILYPKEDADSLYLCQRELEHCKTSGSFKGEGWRVRKDGSRFWARLHITTVTDDDGNFIGYCKIAQDMTPIKNIQDELRRKNEELENLIDKKTDALRLSDARLRVLMENANDGIIVTDLQGKISEANGKMLELFQRPAAEVIGYNYIEFLVADNERAPKEQDRRKSSGPSIAKNFSIKRPDGSVVEVEFSTSVVKIGDEGVLFSVAHDLTERNRLQRNSIQSEKLATMGTLTASVAHEINNPLSYVLTSVDLLNECMATIDAKNLNEKKPWIEKSLKQIKEGIHRVKVIAHDLKIFSRSRDTEKDSVFNLEPILESSINLAASEIKYRAKVVKEFGKISPVKAHEGRLGQVFLNLLINAAHAIQEGNTNGNEIRVTTSMHSGRVAVDIRDTGCGIAPEVMKRLFTPFFTTKPFGLGTGLGLTICQNIVQGFGGEITVESKVGQGTLFRILLPGATESVEALGTLVGGTKASEVVRRGRVLIIDDELDLAEVYSQALSQNHEVVIMTNGGRALELLQQDNHFDIILSDLTMPDMTGMDIYRELHRLGSGIEEKIVFITGGVFTPRALEFLRTNKNKLIEKPIETEFLRRLVQEFVLRHHDSVANKKN